MTVACYFCGKSEHQVPLQLCKKCKVASYCSRECQVNDWNVHKPTCKLTRKCRDGMKADGCKQSYRLWRDWADDGPIPEALVGHYSLDGLEKIQKDNNVIYIPFHFDYNKRTFLPTSPPSLMDRSLYLQHNPDILPIEVETKDGEFLAWFNYTERRVVAHSKMALPQLAKLSAEKELSLLRFDSWDEIVQEIFYPHTANLQKSIIDSWEPLKLQNFDQQVDLLKKSPNYQPFVLNALGMMTSHPRYKTHMVVVHVKLGKGLGQIDRLTGYQVLTLQEAQQLLRAQDVNVLEKDTARAVELGAEKKGPDSTVRVRVLYQTNADFFLDTSELVSVPSNRDKGGSIVHRRLPQCTSDAVASRYFDKLSSTITFPAVSSPALD